MLDVMRSGGWITRERARMIAFILLAFYAVSTIALFVTSDGRVDRMDRPLGTDFSQVWVAGKAVLDGHPERPFDNEAHDRAQREAFTPTSGFFHWGYPPYFLPVAALFALFPYALALILWQGATLPLYLAAVRSIAPVRDGLLFAAAFPAVFVNIGHGHNGFLSAGLMAFGLLALERRPWLAGVLFGLLAYKPQFGILIPVALIAAGCWRAVFWAGLTIAAMTLATWLAFGTQTWTGFFHMMEFSRTVVSEQGATGWHKIQTVFAVARMWGASIALAYAAQAVSTLACAGIVGWLWMSGADRRLAGAALMTGALLATPYALDYDMMLIGPAIAFVVAHGLEKGFRDWEKTILGCMWFAPIIARTVAEATFVPLGVFAMIAFMAMIVRRALADRALEPAGSSAQSGLSHEVKAFSFVGLVGFAVDAGLTLLFSEGLGIDAIAARPPAIAIAIVATWALNRTMTFRSDDPAWFSELLRYGASSLIAAALNFAIYSAVVMALDDLMAQPAVVLAGLFAGSGAAAVANFLAARFLVFRASAASGG